MKFNWSVLGTALLFGVAATGPRAEVSMDILGPGNYHIVVLGVTEGPDPFGMWVPVRPIEPDRMLNISGAARGDGRPDISRPDTDVRAVVWAYQTGTDFDIAFSEWTGISWADPVFLTSSLQNEIDPRVYAEEDGSVHVTWWAQETRTVHLISRDGVTRLWGHATEMTVPGTTGRRPSVTIWNGSVYIAFERHRTASGGLKEVVVIRQQDFGAFEETVVALVERSKPLDVIVHVHGGLIWVDWKHSAFEFGYSVGGVSSWGEVETVEWPDHSWVGEEDARARIRNRLFAPDLTPVSESRGDPDGDRFQLLVADPPPHGPGNHRR